MATPEELYEAARKLIAEAERIQGKEASRPKEPEMAGSYDTGDYSYNCVCFQKQFNHASPYYTYAAIRINGYWYVTGAVHGKEKWTWNQLLEFIGEESWESIVQMEEGRTIFE